MRDEKAALALKQEFGSSVDIRCGEEGICSVAECAEADTVLVAIVGIAGLGATMRAVQAGKRVALANKGGLDYRRRIDSCGAKAAKCMHLSCGQRA